MDVEKVARFAVASSAELVAIQPEYTFTLSWAELAGVSAVEVQAALVALTLSGLRAGEAIVAIRLLVAHLARRNAEHPDPDRGGLYAQMFGMFGLYRPDSDDDALVQLVGVRAARAVLALYEVAAERAFNRVLEELSA